MNGENNTKPEREDLFVLSLGQVCIRDLSRVFRVFGGQAVLELP